MKHLLSLAALAATVALLLTLPGIVRADNDAATTIPDPSGAMSCYGTNSNGSSAAWTVGGEIRYLSDYQNPSTNFMAGYTNIKMINTANRGGCEWQVSTSSNINSGCAQITGTLYIYYTPDSGGSGSNSSPQIPGTYAILNPSANILYTRATPFSFADIDDVTHAQYKVTSAQNGTELGRAATPYL